MNIVYNVQLTPDSPVCYDYETFDIVADSSLVLKKTDSYISLSGSYYTGDKINPVSSHIVKGTSLYPKVLGGTSLKLKEVSEDTLVEASKVISLLTQSTTSDAFKALQKFVRKATRVAANTYEIPDVLTSNSEAIFFSVDTGVVTLVEVGSVVNSNIIPTGNYDSTLFYFLLGNSFKVDAKETYIISKEDVRQIPFGFCNIAYKKPARTSIEFRQGLVLLKAKKHSTITATFPVKLDGVLTKLYTTKGSEDIILESSPEPDLLNNIGAVEPDTLTMVYYLEDDGSLTPSLLVVGTTFSHLFSNLSPISYNTLINYNDETKKRYVYNTYKVSINEDGVFIGNLYNQAFYNNIIQNKALYANITTMV